MNRHVVAALEHSVEHKKKIFDGNVMRPSSNLRLRTRSPSEGARERRATDHSIFAGIRRREYDVLSPSDFVMARAHAVYSLAIGLGVRFLKVTIPS
jgi:hypothetical protein